MKYYVVWKGKTIGIFNDWILCKESIRGYRGAIYKGFKTLSEAEEAFNCDPILFIGKTAEETERLKREDVRIVIGEPADKSICTGGYYDNIKNTLSYWGVDPVTNDVIFENKQIDGGNKYECRLLPIVHALAHLKKSSIDSVVYTRNKQVPYYIKNDWYLKCFNGLDKNSQAYQLLERAKIWLSENEVKDRVLIWDDLHWGKMPGLHYKKKENKFPKLL
jgi:ribonuclease HI